MPTCFVTVRCCRCRWAARHTAGRGGQQHRRQCERQAGAAPARPAKPEAGAGARDGAGGTAVLPARARAAGALQGAAAAGAGGE